MGRKRREKRQASLGKQNEGNNMLLAIGILLAVLVGVAAFFVVTQEKEEVLPDILVEETEEELPDPTELESHEVHGMKVSYLNRYNAGDRSFTDEELDWFAKSGDPVMLIAAAGIHKSRNELTVATEILEEAIIAHYDLHQVAHNQAFRMLSDIYINLNKKDDAIRVLSKALKTRQDETNTSYWYGQLGALHLQRGNYTAAIEVYETCVNDFRFIDEEQLPHPCLHQLGLIEAGYKSNMTNAMNYWFRLYTGQLNYWRDDNDRRPIIKLFPLTVSYPDTDTQKERLILSKNIIDEIPSIESTKTPCSEQTHPLEVQGEKFLMTVNRHPMFSMTCFSDEEKFPTLFRLKDVEIRTSGKQMFHDTKFGYQYFYVLGFPYPHTFSYPIPRKAVYGLPLKRLENAIVLSHNDQSYYQFTVNGLTKLVLLLSHPSLSSVPDLKILVEPTPFIKQAFDFLGISSMLVPYEYERYRYHVENLYSIDWIFENSDFSERHLADYQVPPTSALQFARSVIRSKIPAPTKPRNLVIFLHRIPGLNRVSNPQPLYDLLQQICIEHGLEFVIHSGEESLKEQQALFSRALVVLGLDGGGFANMIYCPEDTSVINIPTFPERRTESQHLASIFDFVYYRTKGTLFNTHSSTKKFLDSNVKSIEKTLKHILSTRNQ